MQAAKSRVTSKGQVVIAKRIREKYKEASQEQSQVTTAKYVNGLTTYYDWYSVENNFISSQKSFLSAIREAILAESRWLNLIGE